MCAVGSDLTSHVRTPSGSHQHTCWRRAEWEPCLSCRHSVTCQRINKWIRSCSTTHHTLHTDPVTSWASQRVCDERDWIQIQLDIKLHSVQTVRRSTFVFMTESWARSSPRLFDSHRLTEESHVTVSLTQTQLTKYLITAKKNAVRKLFFLYHKLIDSENNLQCDEKHTLIQPPLTEGHRKSVTAEVLLHDDVMMSQHPSVRHLFCQREL